MEWLPAGTAFGRAHGGHAAVPIDALMGREIEHSLRLVAWAEGGGSGPRPEAIPLPEPPDEARDRASAEDSKAEAWKRRQERRKARSVPAE